MYMSEVATMSNIAGMKNNNGLNCWFPLTIGLSSIGYFDKLNKVNINYATF